MEVWKRGHDGKYALLKTFPICRWSGQLGPKVKEGDRQAPEGFYTITPAQMNPNSAYYLSFDTGYPNAYDRAYGRTGSALMVHGACSSRGCFAMTDEAIAEVYSIAREAFDGGQRTFQFQSYPFRMTPKNLAQHRLDPNMPFWQNLKEGSDYFEAAARRAEGRGLRQALRVRRRRRRPGQLHPGDRPGRRRRRAARTSRRSPRSSRRACSRSSSSTTTAASTSPSAPRSAAACRTAAPWCSRRARPAASAT